MFDMQKKVVTQMRQVVASGTFKKFWIAVAAGLMSCLIMAPAFAKPPVPFEITYNARYDNFEAEASRYLRYDAATSTYQMQTSISLDLLGQTLTSVVEESQVRWEADHPVPLRYQYKQEGLNTRSRSIVFDHQTHTATFNVDDRKGTLAIDGPLYDELSSYFAIREQLVAGAKDIMFEAIDKDTIKTYRYQVGEEAMLETALGKFLAVKLTRIRDDNPKRQTEIWVAKNYDFILLKLVQAEPGDHTIRLDITRAVYNGAPLHAD
jgi:hypothetical protein